MSVSSSSNIANGNYGFEDPRFIDKQTLEEFKAVYEEILSRRKGRWDKVYQNSANNLTRGRVLKRFCRKGIPPEIRGDVWMFLSEADLAMKENPEAYKSALTIPVKKEWKDVITVDLPRTFPENKYFASDSKETSKLNSLENVLNAFAATHPDIGYCQGLNYVAATIMLGLNEDKPEVLEEKSFWLMDKLVTDYFRDYYRSDMFDLRTDCLVLNELLKIKIPDVYNCLQDAGIETLMLSPKWFICAFADVLPIETVFRVFDCLFYEGDKILFRASLTLVKMHLKEILECKEMPNIIKRFKDMCKDKQTLFCHEFIECMFKLPGTLKRNKINELRFKYRKEVEMERSLKDEKIARLAKDSQGSVRASQGSVRASQE